ncbi:MAG: adenine deaminase [Bacteroidota bacterium]
MYSLPMIITGHIIDPLNRRRYSGTIDIVDGRIASIQEHDVEDGPFILPGFVDAHIHIESSMLTPYEFARMALPHGTVATISDPHEIANVCGMEGVLYMLENARKTPLKFHFGAPSCVPATTFETAGAEITAEDIEVLFRDHGLIYLAEMMNYPGVLHRDPMVMRKIDTAKKYNRRIDGHAPGLRGKDAADYIAAGISTDHECFTREEALDKLSNGMKILIREGSAARNFDALIPLMRTHPDELMFCSDDKHPDDLEVGHIDRLVSRSIRQGYDLFDVLRAASVNPVLHYGLDVGLLRVGDRADFILVDDLQDFKVRRTVINGVIVAENGEASLQKGSHPIINNFNCTPKSPADFKINSSGKNVHLIEALDGQLITKRLTVPAKVVNGELLSDPANDQLKVAVVNRYKDAPPAMGMIKNIGIRRGAIASTVAHDSHNIIASGCSDEEICRAVNLLIRCKGGLCVVDGDEELVLPLPIAGLISDQDGISVSQAYSALDKKVKQIGSTLRAPYMTLSFMALLVIPEFKMSDLGLFDAINFKFADLTD